ncbi:MAG: ABC transporter substrate-binding protein [Rhodoplanes sp.]
MEPTLLGRRAFLTFLGCALASRPVPSFAQQKTVRTVGVLIGLANDAETRARNEAFEQGLARDGWSKEKKNLRIIYRFSNGDLDRMQAMAKELVALGPDCILGHSTPVVRALKKATRTIPIVFVSVTDPVGSGFVESLAHPGGNITGFTIFQGTMTGKYLSMLREMVPQVARVAIAYNPASAPGAGSVFLPAFLEAAKQYKIEPIKIQVHSGADIESGFARLSEEDDIGLIVMPDNFTSLHREQFIALAAKYRIPTIYPYRYFVEAGGLLSYGVDAVDLFRRASGYVSRILHGTNPADLPVQAPTKFELSINLKTAKNLNITVPKVLLAGAGEIYQ